MSYDKITGCSHPDWVADGFCDDFTNNKECNFDGGDCCIPEPNRQFCKKCLCLTEGNPLQIECNLTENKQAPLKIGVL